MQERRHPPRRVVLLSESDGLAVLLKCLLGNTADLTRYASRREAYPREGLDDADTVVFDLPRDASDTAIAQIRNCYRGELIVLAERGQRSRAVAPDPAWTLLERPFSAMALGTALGLSGSAAATAPAPKAERYPPVAIPRPARPAPAAPADIKAAAQRAPSWAQLATAAAGQVGLVERASRMIVALTQGWQARRRVRVAGFSAFALVAFTVAFALAAQGRCGPGCDALGTGFSPASTIAPSESSAPLTTGSKRAPSSTAAPAGSAGTGTFRGAYGGRLATTTTARQAATTTRKPSSGGGGSGPTTPTTRPSTTPPTTSEPTTTPPTTSEPTTTPPTTAGP